jgi:hypothetical protein
MLNKIFEVLLMLKRIRAFFFMLKKIRAVLFMLKIIIEVLFMLKRIREVLSMLKRISATPLCLAIVYLVIKNIMFDINLVYQAILGSLFDQEIDFYHLMVFLIMCVCVSEFEV